MFQTYLKHEKHMFFMFLITEKGSYCVRIGYLGCRLQNWQLFLTMIFRGQYWPIKIRHFLKNQKNNFFVFLWKYNASYKIYFWNYIFFHEVVLFESKIEIFQIFPFEAKSLNYLISNWVRYTFLLSFNYLQNHGISFFKQNQILANFHSFI